MHSLKRYLNLALPAGQSCFLWGERKTGKSTYLKQHFPDAVYIDLLQDDVFQSYLNAPERLRQELNIDGNGYDITVWPVQEFLEDLWAGKIWQ